MGDCLSWEDAGWRFCANLRWFALCRVDFDERYLSPLSVAEGMVVATTTNGLAKMDVGMIHALRHIAVLVGILPDPDDNL